MVDASLSRNRRREQNCGSEAAQEVNKSRAGGRRQMLCHFEADREIKGLVDLDGVGKISREELAFGDFQPGSRDMISVDSQNSLHTQLVKFTQPFSGTTPDINHG